jgi:hypothetical protein
VSRLIMELDASDGGTQQDEPRYLLTQVSVNSG